MPRCSWSLPSCIHEDRDPEPNGIEGLADVRIIEATYRSAIERRPVRIEPMQKRVRPDLGQERHFPPVKKAKLVEVESASGDLTAVGKRRRSGKGQVSHCSHSDRPTRLWLRRRAA